MVHVFFDRPHGSSRGTVGSDELRDREGRVSYFLDPYSLEFFHDVDEVLIRSHAAGFSIGLLVRLEPGGCAALDVVNVQPNDGLYINPRKR